VQILSPDGGGETVVHDVGMGDDFVLLAEWNDRDDGAEDFLAVDAAVGVETGDDGRPEEVAVFAAVADGLFGRSAAAADFAALVAGEIDVIADLVELGFGDERALVGCFLKRVADAQLLSGFDESLHE